MSKFKVGDRVRRTSYLDKDVDSGRYFNGEPFVISRIDCHGGIVDPDGMTHGPQYLDHVAEAQAHIESPIRTVTRRIISKGEYGCVKVGKHELSTNTLAVEMVCTEKGFMRSADELRSAAMVLSQLAEFLDEDKGEE